MDVYDSSGGGSRFDIVAYYIGKVAIPLGNDRTIIVPQIKLRENLNLTEKHIRQIANSLEGALQVKIKDEDLKRMKTAQDLSDLT